MAPKPSNEALNETIAECSAVEDDGTRFPALSYEQGVQAALRWVLGDGPNPLEE